MNYESLDAKLASAASLLSASIRHPYAAYRAALAYRASILYDSIIESGSESPMIRAMAKASYDFAERMAAQIPAESAEPGMEEIIQKEQLKEALINRLFDVSCKIFDVSELLARFYGTQIYPSSQLSPFSRDLSTASKRFGSLVNEAIALNMQLLPLISNEEDKADLMEDLKYLRSIKAQS